jgi:hypothetical protein
MPMLRQAAMSIGFYHGVLKYFIMTKVTTLPTYLAKSAAYHVSTDCADPTVPTHMFVQTEEHH